jgi:hypothetical protein
MHRLTPHQVIFMTPTPPHWHPWTSSCSTVDNPPTLQPPRTDDLDVGSGLSDVLSSEPDAHQLESQGADKAAGSLRAWNIGINNNTHTHTWLVTSLPTHTPCLRSRTRFGVSFRETWWQPIMSAVQCWRTRASLHVAYCTLFWTLSVA